MDHGILFLNPGSTSQGRKGSGESCAILTIEGTQVNAALLTLPKMATETH
jgi:predicted phosphodiesterase